MSALVVLRDELLAVYTPDIRSRADGEVWYCGKVADWWCGFVARTWLKDDVVGLRYAESLTS